MFEALTPPAADSLMQLAALLKAEARSTKIDLGVGTYRDDAGDIPIMQVVKVAERMILESQSTKGYLGPLGDETFAALLQGAVLPGLAAESDSRVARMQTPGGAGALRLGLQIIAQANPDCTLWLATPTWPVHLPLAEACGLRVRTYGHLDAAGSFNAEALETVFKEARSGDAVLVHGCCHNPTGVDLPIDAWRALAEHCGSRGVIPIIDLAYPGLGESLEADVAGAVQLLDAVPGALVALSCSKIFSLYRERTGALLAICPTRTSADTLSKVAATHARLLWSNPPDHGAAVVRAILDSDDLTADWRRELDDMRMRVNKVREAIAAMPLPRLRLQCLAWQKGMFACLPLTADEIRLLREEHAIFVDASGRINVAGLNSGNIGAFSAAMEAVDHRR